MRAIRSLLNQPSFLQFVQSVSKYARGNPFRRVEKVLKFALMKDENISQNEQSPFVAEHVKRARNRAVRSSFHIFILLRAQAFRLLKELLRQAITCNLQGTCYDFAQKPKFQDRRLGQGRGSSGYAGPRAGISRVQSMTRVVDTFRQHGYIACTQSRHVIEIHRAFVSA